MRPKFDTSRLVDDTARAGKQTHSQAVNDKAADVVLRWQYIDNAWWYCFLTAVKALTYLMMRMTEKAFNHKQLLRWWNTESSVSPFLARMRDDGNAFNEVEGKIRPAKPSSYRHFNTKITESNMLKSIIYLWAFLVGFTENESRWNTTTMLE